MSRKILNVPFFFLQEFYSRYLALCSTLVHVSLSVVFERVYEFKYTSMPYLRCQIDSAT